MPDSSQPMRPRERRTKRPPTPLTERAVLNFDALCDYISLGKTSVYQLLSEGKLPAPISIGGRNNWLRADIDKWLLTLPKVKRSKSKRSKEAPSGD